MRRIIERVVTVVTTTTWTISWQGDPLQPDAPTDPVADDFPKPDGFDQTAKHFQRISSLITTKEDDPEETKLETYSIADKPPLSPNSNQAKIERK